MLSRYKQAYNILTHSKAFAEDGSFDNSKVNKDRFTPHNLRTLIICSNRLFLINYVTGGVFGSIVEEKACNSPIAVNGFKEQKDYEQWFQKEPGVIDALGIKKDGKLLTFNCLESIVLVDDGGWNQQEMNKEYHRITQFVNNIEVSKTMNRLRAVLFVKGVNPDGFRELRSDIPVSKFLKDKGIQCQAIKKFEITKTDEGLLPSPKLDSGNYIMDSKYDPQNPSDNQNCRLSKYFYDARQKEIRYLEQKKAEAQNKVDLGKKEEKPEEKKPEVSQKVMVDKEIEDRVNELWIDVLPIYEDLYRNAIERGCKGVLVKSGYLGLKDGKIMTTQTMWDSELYSSFERGLEKQFQFKPSDKLLDMQVNDLKENNYFQRFHAYNACGICSIGENGVVKDKTRRWDKFTPYLEKRFKTLATRLFSQASKNNLVDVYGQIKAKLTNCIIVEEYDRNKLIQLKYKLGVGGNSITTEYNSYFENNCGSITQKESCEILNDSITQNNVITLMGVFDAKKFAAEALFSYQAYENFVKNGGQVGLNNVIIGRQLNGKDEKFSLTSNDSRVIAIFAGSGSGKGVMTLGLLSAIVANRVPFMYLDYKPDMAEMLWEIEGQLKNAGITRTDGKECRILAIDSKQDINNCNPIRGHIFGENMPEYMSNIPAGSFSVIPYLKLLQLYYLLGSLRVNEERQAELGGKFFYAILDEFQQNMVENLTGFLNVMESEKKNLKSMKDERAKDVERYVNKMNMVINGLGNETATFINTDGRKSRCRAIYLGQNSDYSIWKGSPNASVKNLTSAWYSNTSVRFYGRNCGSGSYSPTNNGAVAKFINNPDTFGYWTYAIGAGKVADIKDWPVFKAYSVLNENDYNINNPESSGRFTSSVIANIQDERVIEDLKTNVFVATDNNGNACVREEVGFLGLVKKLSGLSENEIADAMSEGYEVIWKVMCEYGLNRYYSDIESYLFDCSLESIYTTNEIRSGVNRVVENETESDTSLVFGDDFDYSDNSDDVIDTPITNNQGQRQQPQSQPFNQGSRQPQQQSPQRPIRPQRPQQNNQDLPDNKEWIDEVGYSVDSKGNITGEMDVYKPKEYQFDEYNGHLTIEDNPFERYDANSKIGGMLCVKELTYIIRKDIETAICPTHMVKSVIIKDNKIAINDILYTPQFDDRFIQSLPMAIRNKVQNGEIVELLDMRMLYRYHNLEHLVVEDKGLAQGRARKEMGIGFRKRWSVLFEKFDNLYHLTMGDAHYFRDNPDNNDEDEILENFKKNPSSTYSTAAEIGSGLMNRVWDSKPCRILTKAAGWTVGVQAVWLMASLCGPWGLLFGAFAAYNTMKEINKDRPQRPTYNNQQYQGGYQSKPQQPQGQQPKKKSTNNQGSSTNKKKPQNNSNNSGNSGDTPWYGDTKWNY